jgi:LemA protein
MRNIIIAIVVLVALYVGSTYNTLITKNEMVTTQWSQVESQYQRRLDLIPNLVGSVQGIMNQEQEVFKAIADARSRYAGSTTPDEKAASATQVESALARLLVVMENYPQLRSVETVQTLMAELAGTENRVAVERMRYNEVVRDFNITVKTYPSGWVAALFGIPARELFEAAEGADVAPTVNFE